MKEIKQNLCAILVVLLLLSVLTAIVIFKPAPLTEFDLKILTKIQNWFAFIPVQIPIFISDFGYKVHMVPQLVITGAVMLWFRKWKEFLGFLILTQGVTLMVTLIKDFVERPRPDIIYRKIVKTSFCFPSGHSSVNMFFYLTLLWLICCALKNKPAKIVVGVILIGWILSVGFSRVFLGVHYPSDVLGGYLLGILLFLVFVLYTNVVCKPRAVKDDKQN